MWVTVLYRQASARPKLVTLRRISKCYKSWIGDSDKKTVKKLVKLLLRRHSAEQHIIDRRTHAVFLRHFEVCGIPGGGDKAV